ncbi:MAG: hypothetical protein J3K34DRAFT_438403 [Monoraphidium minutum]|nr:MAG: hypothetical protein J3K34DRAFT_438403 [Monoraphidium minutum]
MPTTMCRADRSVCAWAAILIALALCAGAAEARAAGAAPRKLLQVAPNHGTLDWVREQAELLLGARRGAAPADPAAGAPEAGQAQRDTTKPDSDNRAWTAFNAAWSPLHTYVQTFRESDQVYHEVAGQMRDVDPTLTSGHLEGFWRRR